MDSVAISWSGGKDCCLSLWKVISQGYHVKYLFNTVRNETSRVAFHGIKSDLIIMQADSLGLPLIQRRVGDNDYANIFLEGLEELKRNGVDEIVFGDIDIRQNREWCERIAAEGGLKPIFPLWGIDQKTILTEFVNEGFKAIIVAVDSDFFDEKDAGRPLDYDWIDSLDDGKDRSGKKQSTYCGENGEYHSFVFDGPLFNQPIQIHATERVYRSRHWLIDIVPLVSKCDTSHTRFFRENP